MIFFEKGIGRLSNEDNKRISNLVKDVVEFLTGKRKSYPALKTILLEICGNSIEHSESENRQWLLGVKFETDKVIFTVTDVGKGILQTLHRKFLTILAESFSKSKLDILMGAFEKKYGSSTKEDNRNKGLPSIKANFDDGIIQELIVVTNNVLLDFNQEKSKIYSNNTNRFRGTLYQWIVTKNCLK